MAQKIVSYEVAKALEGAGYPQEYSVFGGTTCHYKNENTIQYHSAIGCYENVLCAAPTYLSAWLWLWREKKIYIDINCIQCSEYNTEISIWHEYGQYHYECKFTDPEEAIEMAIEYLIKNNLIK